MGLLKIVAGLIVKNEADRYLRWTLEQLLSFCHAVVVLDDGSSDTTQQVLNDVGLSLARGPELVVHHNHESVFFQHEGRARQQLMDLVLAQQPTHVIATDADEFISDTRAVWRAIVEHWEGSQRDQFRVWTLPMQEVWKADEGTLWLRVDGGWKAHGVPVVYSVPPRWERKMRIQDRALACGRQPEMVNREALARRAIQLPSEVLHFGWTRVAERAARYERYAVADGGRFHRNTHLESIMWDDRRVRLDRRQWPDELLGIKPLILRKVNS